MQEIREYVTIKKEQIKAYVGTLTLKPKLVIVQVNEEILTMYGSNIYLELNENMTLLDLVYGLMLRSGNELALTK